MHTTKQWLCEASWDKVVTLNQSLCEAQKQTPKTHLHSEKAKAIWQKAFPKQMGLIQALETCRSCNELRPFVFNCSNTFASLAKNMIEDWASQLPSLEAHMLRSTVTHFVDGKVTKKELQSIVKHLETRPRTVSLPEEKGSSTIDPEEQRQPA